MDWLTRVQVAFRNLVAHVAKVFPVKSSAPPACLILMDRLKLRFFRQTSLEAAVSSVHRRKAMVSWISRNLPYIKFALARNWETSTETAPRFTLFLVGYTWMALLPLPLFGQETYIDENALQPGQVRLFYRWTGGIWHEKHLGFHVLELGGCSSCRSVPWTARVPTR